MERTGGCGPGAPRPGLCPPDMPAAGLQLSLPALPQGQLGPQDWEGGGCQPGAVSCQGQFTGAGGRSGASMEPSLGLSLWGPPLAGHRCRAQQAPGLLTQLARRPRDFPWDRPCKKR